MTTSVCAAGIDVGRDFLDVALAPSGRGFRAPNIAKGVDIIVDRLKRAGVRRIVLESIGPYASRLVRALARADFHVAVVDPRRIKAWRTAEGKRAKTDRLDAQLIARFALVMSDASNIPRVRFEFTDCLPIKLKAPSFNAKDGAVAIEEMQIAYSSFTIRPA